MQSLLGAAPKRQQELAANPYTTQQFVNQHDQSYLRRSDVKESTDYFGSKQQLGDSQQYQARQVPRDRNDGPQQSYSNLNRFPSGWTNRSPSPIHATRDSRVDLSSSDPWNWSASQLGYDSRTISGQSQGIPSLQMTQGTLRSSGGGGQSSDQQMVMLMPQGNGGAGLLGITPMQQTLPNTYNLMQQQQPMQLLMGNLGNLQGLNPTAFGQQPLMTARPNTMMSLFDSSIMEGGSGIRRFSQQTNKVLRSRPSTNFRTRSDHSSSSKSINRGSASNSSAVSRGKKRVMRDRLGATNEVDRKKPKKGQDNDQSNRKASAIKNGKQKKKGNNSNNNKANKNEKSDDTKKGETNSDGKKDQGESSKADKIEDKDKSKDKKNSKYDQIPASFFVCKICQKVMNDADSFESHVNGRAHSARIKILEQRFEKRAQLLVADSKLSEEEIGIEMQRQRRAGKPNIAGGSKNFCSMCDCHYTVSWGSHKVSIWHRILKDYLHPVCNYCNMNFVHRIDWVKHLYSLVHLKKLAELKEQGEDITAHENCRQDELFSVNIDLAKNEFATPVLVLRPDNYKMPTVEELNEMLKGENGELDIPIGEINIPTEFEEDQAYGEEAIADVDGSCCKVCRIFIGIRKDIEAHVKSKSHFSSYVTYLKKVVKYRENLKVEQEKAEKEAAKEAERQKKAKEEKEPILVKKQDDGNGDAEEEEIEMESEEGVDGEDGVDTEADVETEPIDNTETEEIEELAEEADGKMEDDSVDCVDDNVE